MDILTRGVAKEGRIRAFCCDTTELVELARQKHDSWPTATAALGRTLSVGCIMGSMLKSKQEKTTIQINGGGELGTIMVDAFYDGQVRGFCANPQIYLVNEANGKLDVGKAVGKNGYLKVIKDLGMKQPWIGQVELQSGEIGDDFAYYFTLSEQTPSMVSVGVLISPENKVIASGAIIIQVLPDSLEEDILDLEHKIKHLLPVSTMIEKGMTPKEILDGIFDDYQELATMPLRFECICSRERCLNVLNTIALKDLKDILEEDKQCEMVCEFCSTKYQFNEQELREVYEKRLANEKHHL